MLSDTQYAALGRACEANGLGWYAPNGEMRFQPAAELIAENAARAARTEALSTVGLGSSRDHAPGIGSALDQAVQRVKAWAARYNVSETAGDEPWPTDPAVGLVYELLCDTVEPPEGHHWEGWIAEIIVAALSSAKPALGESSRDDHPSTGEGEDATLIAELRARGNARHSGEISPTADLCQRAANRLEALSARLEARVGEPVAWAFEYEQNGKWEREVSFHPITERDKETTDYRNITPLYAGLPDPVGGGEEDECSSRASWPAHPAGAAATEAERSAGKEDQ